MNVLIAGPGTRLFIAGSALPIALVQCLVETALPLPEDTKDWLLLEEEPESPSAPFQEYDDKGLSRPGRIHIRYTWRPPPKKLFSFQTRQSAGFFLLKSGYLYASREPVF